jgi:hypothetical protein
VGLSFIIFTPVLILVSWLLQILVDDPYKDFAYELDIVSRKQKPLNVKNRSGVQGLQKADDEDDEAWFWPFLKQSWKFFALLIYFLILYVVTESYQSYANKESDMNYNAEG